MPAREITIRVYVDEKDVNRAAANIEGALGKALQTDKLQAFARQATGVGTALSVGITAPLGLIAKEVLRVGDEYQRAMNDFQVATKASASEMRAAAETAKRLGADMTLPATSAGDAALAMTELAKGGLSAKEAMDAAKGSLQLAAAANIDAAQAAKITANALNIFGLAGKDAGRVADLLAATANAASGEITDMAAAMQQSGAAAKLVGLPIEDLSTAIGIMAKNGILGSDAGTSLKTALINLNPHSKAAAKEMQELGFNAFDAQGKLKPLRQIVDEFTTATAGLTAQQKLQSIETIFGTDAMRAASLVFAGGVQVFDELKEKVTQQSAVAEIAAAKTKGLGGAWEGLKSQLETGAIILFERMSPTLEKIVRELAGMADSVISGAAAFAKANPGLTEFAIKTVAVLAAVGPLLIAVSGLIAGIGFISTPALAAAGAIAGIGIAFAAVTTAANYLRNSYTELSGVTAKQVVDARELVAQRKLEVDQLERVVREGSASQETYASIVEEYRKLNPLTRARADLLISESKETSEAQKMAAALLKIKREMYEVDKAAAQVQFAKLAKDFFDATQNLNKAQQNVARISQDFATYTKQARDYEEAVRAGGGAVGIYVERLADAKGRLKDLAGEYDGAKEDVRKYGEQVNNSGRELNALSEAYGISKKEIIDHARAIGANTGDTVTAINALSRAGVAGAEQARKFSAAWVEAQDEIKQSGKTLASDLVSGFTQGIQSSQGKSLAAVTNWMKAANQAARDAVESKSPSKVFQRIGIDIGEGLTIGILAKASDVAKASRELAKAAIDDARKAAAEAIALANASLATLQYIKQKKDADEFADALQDILKLRRELGQDETAALPRTRALAIALRDMLKEQADGLKEAKKRADELNQSLLQLAENNGDLLNAERSLNNDRKNWAAEQSRRWLESQRQQEQTIQAVSREVQIRKQAQDAIKQADADARDSIIRNRVFIADQTVFHSDRATAAVLDHLARQKGVTETVADAFISLYDGVFNKLDSLIDGWTSKLGVFGSFVGTLMKGIVNTLANSILKDLLGENGILGKVINGLGNTISGAINGILKRIGINVPSVAGTAGATGSAAGAGATGGLFGGLGGLIGLAGAGIGLGGAIGGTGASGAIGRIGGAVAGAGAFGLLAGFGGTAAAVGSLGVGTGLAASAGALLSNPITAIAGVALLAGSFFLNRAKQRRSDEEKSGEALQAAVDLIKTTATSLDNDEFKFADANEAQSYLNDAILEPFKNFINTLKTKSVRDSRLTNQVRDLENLYNSLVGDAIKRQQERLAAAAANTSSTTTTSSTGSTTTPDPFANLVPTTVTIEELNIEFLVGTNDASKVAVTGIKTKEGQKVVVETVKIAAASGEL